jgi:hypothetical protein
VKKRKIISLTGHFLSIMAVLSISSYAVSFKSLFNENSIIVYGSQNKATAKEETVIAYNLKKQMKSFINMTSDTNISNSSLSSNNLIILSADLSNNILNFSNLPNVKANFPIEIKENYFYFGNKYYSNKKEGIAFIYPSPYNAKNFVLIYYSNSVEGLENLTKNLKIINNDDYQIINESGQLIREGEFNKNNFRWSFDTKLDKDYEKALPGAKAQKIKKTDNFTFYYYENSFASKTIDIITNQYESFYAQLKKAENIPLKGKVNIHLYDTNEDKEKESLNFQNLLTRDIYTVFNSRQNDLLTDFTRFYYNDVLDFSDDKVIIDGFINYAKDLKTGDLDKKIAKLYSQNKVPALLPLLKGEKVSSDSDIIIGSFTKYLINRYGLTNYKEIISRAKNLDEADVLADITPTMYTSFSGIEREWIYTLSDLTKKL